MILSGATVSMPGIWGTGHVAGAKTATYLNSCVVVESNMGGNSAKKVLHNHAKYIGNSGYYYS